MSCCRAGFPDPNSRQFPSSYNVSNRPPAPGRTTFFSSHLHHASAVLSNPSTINFREFIVLLFGLFALFHGFFAAKQSYNVLAVQSAVTTCGLRSPMGCAWHLLWYHIRIAMGWAGNTAPWAFVAAAVVFVGEEVIRAMRKK